MATTTAVIGVLSTLATTAKGVYDMTNRPSAPKAPQPQDMSAIGRALLPGARANAAANTGGGMDPEFMNSLLQQQTGDPNLNILGDIRKSLNLPEAP